jgi:hypothetical protein
MASARSVVPDAEPSSKTRAISRPPRKPPHKDPLSLLGWSVALAALVAFWYLFVRKAPPQAGDEVARLTALAGQVKLKAVAREAWTDARVFDRLRVGDVVQTEAASAAEISFDAGNVVRVRPDSVVHIGGSAESSTAAWRVQAGHVNFSVGSQLTEILTPSVKATADRDSAGNIDVNETGATGVKIFRGQARIQTTLAQRITLSANEAVQVDAVGKAGAKLALPPPPTLLGPPPRTRIPAASVATLSWSAVAEGVSYRLGVDYNVTQANLLLAAALDEPGITATSHDLKSLDPGRYFWRVAAVNQAGLEGAFSRVSMFAVVPPEPAPPPTAPSAAPPALVLDALEEVAPGVVHVEGRTVPGATVTVNGAPVQVMPDGSFSEYVQQRQPRALVVRASAPDGRWSERTLPLSRR